MTVKKSPCAPKIWKKFDDREKKMWMKFYVAFTEDYNFHSDWVDKKYRAQQLVTAHNMACQAVWAMGDSNE